MQLTKAEIARTQVIVTTPEKWDVVTRKPSGEGGIASVGILLRPPATYLILLYHRAWSSWSLMKYICWMRSEELSSRLSLREHCDRSILKKQKHNSCSRILLGWVKPNDDSYSWVECNPTKLQGCRGIPKVAVASFPHSMWTQPSILVLRRRKAFFISTPLSDPSLLNSTFSVLKEKLAVCYPARILTMPPSRKSQNLLPTVIKSWYLSMHGRKQSRLRWVCVRWPCWKETLKTSPAKTTLSGTSIVKKSANRGIKKWSSYSMEALASIMQVCFAQTGIWWKKCSTQRLSRCVKQGIT